MRYVVESGWAGADKPPSLLTPPLNPIMGYQSPCEHLAAIALDHLLRDNTEPAIRAKLGAFRPSPGPKGERPQRLAGVRIDWHVALPELKIWAGQSTMATILDARCKAIVDEPLLTQQAGLPSMSGLDPRSSASAIDIGFSPQRHSMLIATYVGAEVLMVLGLQLVPITRLGRNQYAYDFGRRWRFGPVERSGYHRMLSWSEALP